ERNYAAIPKGWPGYTEYGIKKYTFDMNKAKELIEKSGIDPTKYTIEITYNTGNSAREKVATLLQNTWSQLGFQVTVSGLEWPVYLSKGEHGQFDFYIIAWVPDYLDTDNWVGPLYYGATAFKEVTVSVE
ncbi:ABC transporter substrate-binding protein, partial [Geoglobus sp.]